MAQRACRQGMRKTTKPSGIIDPRVSLFASPWPTPSPLTFESRTRTASVARHAARGVLRGGTCRARELSQESASLREDRWQWFLDQTSGARDAPAPDAVGTSGAHHRLWNGSTTC